MPCNCRTVSQRKLTVRVVQTPRHLMLRVSQFFNSAMGFFFWFFLFKRSFNSVTVEHQRNSVAVVLQANCSVIYLK